MRLVWPELAGLSFPDQPVRRWGYDAGRRQLVVVISDGWLDASGGMLGLLVELTIGPWSGFRGERFTLDRVVTEVHDPSEPLGEVCECDFGPSSVWVAGFGTVSGDWLRYAFTGEAVGVCRQDAEPFSRPTDSRDDAAPGADSSSA